MMTARQAALPPHDPVRRCWRASASIPAHSGQYQVGGPAELHGHWRSREYGDRLEALNKRYGTAVMIGDETRRATGNAILCRQFVGSRLRPHRAWPCMNCWRCGGPMAAFAWVKDYEAGMDAYIAGFTRGFKLKPSNARPAAMRPHASSSSAAAD
jgi:hypothetical protein